MPSVKHPVTRVSVTRDTDSMMYQRCDVRPKYPNDRNLPDQIDSLDLYINSFHENCMCWNILSRVIVSRIVDVRFLVLYKRYVFNKMVGDIWFLLRLMNLDLKQIKYSIVLLKINISHMQYLSQRSTLYNNLFELYSIPQLSLASNRNKCCIILKLACPVIWVMAVRGVPSSQIREIATTATGPQNSEREATFLIP